jgi:hypothetical protein
VEASETTYFDLQEQSSHCEARSPEMPGLPWAIRATLTAETEKRSQGESRGRSRNLGKAAGVLE